jgi:hypothetical protein
LNLLSKAQVELSSNEIPFSYQNWTKKLMFFHLYFDSYLWSSFEYKKMVRELSKIVHKFTEAEQFVFISEQSAKHHDFCSYNRPLFTFVFELAFTRDGISHCSFVPGQRNYLVQGQGQEQKSRDAPK